MRCHRVVYDAVHAWGQDTEEFTSSELLAGCRGSPPTPPPRGRSTTPQFHSVWTSELTTRVRASTAQRSHEPWENRADA